MTRPSNDRSHIGRFRVLSNLGQGGMGVVYRVFDPRLEREVALKVLRPELLSSASAIERFQREALAATRLDHPGLCRVYEVGEADGQPYIVMPLLTGETLAARIARESEAGVSPADRARLDTVLALFEKVARALHHAHEAGLVHRDIKPGNILVQTDGEPVVLDFGLARSTADEVPAATRFGESPGTPLYMAPEQLSRSGAELDASADVYALGITLYEALALAPPFAGRSLHELFEQIRSQPTPDLRARNTAASRDLQVVVAVATDKTPSRRYRSCAELADDLRRVRRGEPITARPVPRLTRVARWLRRNPAAALLIAVLAGGIAIASQMLLQNSIIAGELGRLVQSETGLRREAEELRHIVAERLERFDLLAVELQIDEIRAAATEALPAWPTNVSALRSWLDRVDTELRPLVPRVDHALRRLRALSTGVDPEHALPEPPLAEKLRLLEKCLASLRAADEVRRGERSVELEPVRIDGPDTLREVLELVEMHTMRHCGPERSLGFFGDEPYLLKLTTYVVERQRVPHHGVLALHAWALFANGLDEDARIAMARAVAVAPADDRGDIEQEQHRLQRALREADAELEIVEQLSAEFRPIVDAPRNLRFADPADHALYEILLRLRVELLVLLNPVGLAADMERARRWSMALDELTERHPNARVSWAEARAAIAAADGIVASELYAESPIDLKPQAGLVPIGMNPVTRLWEFYHLRSALPDALPDGARQLEIPGHRPDGSIAVGHDTGIVFVLIPGGITTVGSQRDDPDGPNFCPDSVRTESLMTGDVEPFFLARHELTQGQWLRLVGARDRLAISPANPSAIPAGVVVFDRWISLRHPVENASFVESMSLLSRHGLTLPTEWQWEHACRGGTPFSYWCGRDAASLEGNANILDASAARAEFKGPPAEFDDGWVFHAPVGSYSDNPFGLFDVHGNVAELTRTRFTATLDPVTIRGGSYSWEAVIARSAVRVVGEEREGSIGLRACRELQR